MTIAVANYDVHIFAREIDMVHRRRDPQIDFGMSLGEPAQPMDQPLGGEIRRGAYRQHPGTLALREALGRHGDAIKCVAHGGQIIAAGFGDDEPLPLAIEQLDAELRLQRLYLMAHRALRDAKLRGGVREADVPGSGLEGLKRIELGQAARHCPIMRKTQTE